MTEGRSSDRVNPAVATFVQEAREQIEGLEGMLLDLEGGADPAMVDAVFRTLHTVKGSGAMFGFETLARFAHHFENAFDLVRDGKLAVDARLIDLSLKARDHMSALLDCGGDGAAATELEASPAAAAILAALAETTGGGHPAPTASTAAPAAGAAEGGASEAPTRYVVLFRPTADALRNGMRPDLLIEELRGLGEAEVTLDASGVPALEDMDPGASYLAWRVALSTTQPRSAVEAVFVFADDADLEIVEERPAEAAPPAAAQAGPGGAAPAGAPAAAPERQTPKAAGGDNIRVSAERLDQIMDQLGEMVIAQARLAQISARLEDGALEAVSEEIERLVTSMRDTTLSIRMLPIEVVFGKFRRVVRELSAELGKEVRLVAEGGETEIDKNVIDRLSEPLVHMIRNSVDHGVEKADAREAAGKPRVATVRLSARQEGGEVLIAIEDDGAGLNTAAIRAKAVERNLIAPDAEMSEMELNQLIFAPGFSTAAAVSSVSGRGVGMDAVQSAVDALRGHIEVLSRPGRGTRVTLRLPVTLAIIDGLLVRLGSSSFVIPLGAVEECVEFDEAERRRESGRSVLQIREHLVPYLDLDAAFSRPPSVEPRRRVVIVRADGARIGLVVDDILGQHQTVIKTLSVYHRGVQGFAGATILGDGSVALIVDVATLARRAAAERRDGAQRTAA